MSNAAPPLQPAGLAGKRATGPLTPERVDGILADFRRWLSELPATEGAPPPAEPVDLHTLVGQFIALRHEVNLQTKASRATLEQNAEALRQLESAVAHIGSRPDGEADSAGPLLKAVIDVHDALALAAQQVERQRESIAARLQTAIDDKPTAPPPGIRAQGFFQRLVGGRQLRDDAAALAAWSESATRRAKEREELLRETSAYLRDTFASLLTGYAMSLNRIESVLPKLGVEAMNCAGQRFDPETMEAIDVVADSNRSAGEVIEEVRRGYMRNGTVFRFAQVRVAR
jgi:molecular chaperone GrpE